MAQEEVDAGWYTMIAFALMILGIVPSATSWVLAIMLVPGCDLFAFGTWVVSTMVYFALLVITMEHGPFVPVYVPAYGCAAFGLHAICCVAWWQTWTTEGNWMLFSMWVFVAWNSLMFLASALFLRNALGVRLV